MKQRILCKLLVLLLLLPLHVMGQVQLGYVKTKGRLTANGSVVPGVRVPGASVIIKGGNAVVSNAKGNFQLSVPNKKFHLVNVKKSGYVLTDPDILSKQYTSSSNPLVIALEKPEEQSEEKMAAMKKIRRTLERQLQEKEDEIDALKAQNKLSAEAYSKALQELYAEREKNGTLIEEMAERYSRIDYDQLDEFNRRVSGLILNGELLKADSLLNTKGDIRTGIADYQRLQQANANEETALAQRQTNLEKSKALEQQQRDDLAQRCYSKFEIFKLQHQNDSAAYYIELRASLDTTNVVWMLDAGNFVCEYLADYNKGMSIFQRALSVSQTLYGEQSENTAKSYNNIGFAYEKQSDYTQALEYYQKGLSLLKSIFGENHLYVATSYHNIGVVNENRSEYEKAMEAAQKALDIRKTILGDSGNEVAMNYNLIGVLYTLMANYTKSVESLQKALALGIAANGEDCVLAGLIYNNMGYAYSSQGDFDMAMECYQKALVISKEVYGENHPEVATTYNNIGYVYYVQCDYSTAIEYFKRTLDVFLKSLGKNHVYVATMYNNIAGVYDKQGQYDKAIEGYQNALSIFENILGQNHDNTAALYGNIAGIYMEKGEFDVALEYFNKQLAISKSIHGEYHPSVALCYNSIGTMYFKERNYSVALGNLNKALALGKATMNEDNPDIALIYGNIGAVYKSMQKYNESLDVYYKSLNIYSTVFKEGHRKIGETYMSIYECFERALLEEIDLGANSFPDFMSDKSIQATILQPDSVSNGTKALDDFYLLECDDWTIDVSTTKDRVKLNGKPKAITVMKGDVISQYQSDSNVKVKLTMKYVGKEEKRRITEAYHAWKAKNK